MVPYSSAILISCSDLLLEALQRQGEREGERERWRDGESEMEREETIEQFC